MPSDSGSKESGGGVLDRINRLLTKSDLIKLKELHSKLSRYSYDLADNVEHLACYLCGEDEECSVSVKGTDERIVVKPEIRLETLVGEKQEIKPKIGNISYEYITEDAEQKEKDLELFNKRKEFISEKEKYTREDILGFEIKLRNKDIRKYKTYLDE